MTATRQGCCARCGVVQYGHLSQPVCGLCAAREIMDDATWAKPRDSHSNPLWLAAHIFVIANTDRDIICQLACSAAELVELRRRLGIKRLVVPSV